MKKLYFTALALSMTLFSQAQLVEVASMERVAAPGVVSEIATISPDGSFAVVGVMGGSKLTKVDFSTGASKVITENGNANGVTISPDGQNIVYRTTTFQNRLRYTGLNSVNLANGKETVVVEPSRRLNAGVAMSKAGVTAVENGKMRVKAFGKDAVKPMPVASINYGHLDITVDGKTTTIDPQGRGSYLWPSISPDGTKVAYYLCGAGAFVCDIDGSNARQLGYLQAPTWLGCDKVVGMASYDNGETITASSIKVFDLNGTSQTITSGDMIAVFPSASADGKKVVFSTTAGDLYLVNLK